MSEPQKPKHDATHHPPHPFVPFPEHMAQNVDSLRKEVHDRDSLQAVNDKRIDDAADKEAARKRKSNRLKQYLKEK